MNLDDQILINRLRNSDEVCFRQVYDLYKKKLYNYFLKKIKKQDYVEDLIQNTFLRLWKYRRSLSTDYLLDQHIFNIAKSVIIDFLRSEQKISKVKTSIFLENKTEKTEDVTIYNIDELLNNLSGVRKEIFLMKKIKGYSYEEISQIFSLNKKAIDNHIYRAMLQLKKSLLIFIYIFF